MNAGRHQLLRVMVCILMVWAWVFIGYFWRNSEGSFLWKEITTNNIESEDNNDIDEGQHASTTKDMITAAPLAASEAPAVSRPYCRTKCSNPDEFSYWIRSGYKINTGQPLICFDGQIIVHPNKSETYSRGVNIVVINAKLKTVMDYRSFDTYASIEACLELVQYLSFNVPPHCQVLAASHDDMSTSLCPKARELLQAFGSKDIKAMKFRDTWVFAGEKGVPGPLGIEKLGVKSPSQEFADVAEIDGCLKIPMSKTLLPMNEDFGLTLDVCGIPNCNYNDISLYISTGVQMFIKPTVCIAGNYVIKPGIRGGRGFNFIVVDPLYKQAIAVRQFDSYARESSGIDLFLENISPDDILIGLVHDEGTTGLLNSTRKLLADFGASMVWDLKVRSVMYFAGRKGLAVSPFQEVSHPPTPQQFPVPLEKRFCLPSEISEKTVDNTNEKKQKFCRSKQGYGSFCYSQSSSSALKPVPVPPQQAAFEIFKVPILVLGGFNHLALTASLSALLRVPGLQSDRVTVAYAEFFTAEYQEVVSLFQFNSFVVPDVSSSSEFMEKALAHVWAQNKDSTHVIVIEEEVLVAPGFLEYMQQALVAMTAGYASIGAASAWNSNSFSHAAADLSATYYVDQFVGLAFLLSKPFYEKHMAGHMAQCCQQRSWRGWFMNDQAMEGYLFLIPEVARADIYRNMDSYQMSITRELSAVARGRRLPLEEAIGPVKVLELPNYARLIQDSVARWVYSSKVVPHICLSNTATEGPSLTTWSNASRPLALIYRQEHPKDYSSLFELCQCFQLACLGSTSSPAGTYGGLLRFSLHGQPTYILGSKSKYFIPS